MKDKTYLIKECRLILLACKEMRQDGPCKNCDLDVGCICAECTLVTSASDLARHYLSTCSQAEFDKVASHEF